MSPADITLRRWVGDFLVPGADPVALTARFRPAPGDYATLFLPWIAEHAREVYEAWWAAPEVLRPERGSDRLRLVVADTAQLAAGHPDFPGGWKPVAQRALRPDLWVGRWRFGRPDGEWGAGWDGLVLLADRAVWLPKPYRLLRAALVDPAAVRAPQPAGVGSA